MSIISSIVGYAAELGGWIVWLALALLTTAQLSNLSLVRRSFAQQIGILLLNRDPWLQELVLGTQMTVACWVGFTVLLVICSISLPFNQDELLSWANLIGAVAVIGLMKRYSNNVRNTAGHFTFEVKLPDTLKFNERLLVEVMNEEGQTSAFPTELAETQINQDLFARQFDAWHASVQTVSPTFDECRRERIKCNLNSEQLFEMSSCGCWFDTDIDE